MTREGPKVRVVRSCFECVHERSEYYAVQGDQGYQVYCAHPAHPGGPRRIGDTTWSTPAWCPIAPGDPREERAEESPMARDEIDVGAAVRALRERAGKSGRFAAAIEALEEHAALVALARALSAQFALFAPGVSNLPTSEYDELCKRAAKINEAHAHPLVQRALKRGESDDDT